MTGASSTARDISGRLRAERTARALAQVGHELLGTLDLDQIATRIVRAVLDVFRARRAVLYELEPTSRTLVCVAAAGPADAAKWVGCHLPAGAGLAWLAVNARRLVASEGALTDGPPSERDAEPFAEETGQSVIAVPLMGQDRVLGALLVGSDPERVYSGEEQHLLAVFGDQAALALRNAQLFTETERGRHIAERLAIVARSVPQSLTFSELARQIADGVAGLLEVRAAAVYRLDPDTWELMRVATSSAGGAALLADPVLARGAGLEGVAASTRQPVPDRGPARRSAGGVEPAALSGWSPPPTGIFTNHLPYAKWYATQWAERMMDVVDQYNPDFIYTDGTVQGPFTGDGTGTGIKADAMQHVIADFYNKTLERRGKVDTFSIVKFRKKTNGTVNTEEFGRASGRGRLFFMCYAERWS